MSTFNPYTAPKGTPFWEFFTESHKTLAGEMRRYASEEEAVEARAAAARNGETPSKIAALITDGPGRQWRRQ